MRSNAGRRRSIEQRKDKEEKGNDDEDEAAGFGAEHAARKPIGAAPGSLQQMADAEFPGVASGVEEHRGPIESGVEADHEGERAGAANRQAAEEAEQAGASEVFPAFVGLGEIVKRAEADGEKNRGGPKADAVGQSAKQVSAEGEFFGDADAKRGNKPPECGAEKRVAVNRESGDAIAVESGDQSHQERNSEKSPEQTLPELRAE